MKTNEFIKPKRIVVNPTEFLQNVFGKGLIKDLHDNEEICEVCHGLGIVIVDNPYGLSDDPDKKAGLFPYKHQSISFCPNCYNGVVHRCKLCGEIINPRGFLRHNCPQQQEEDRLEAKRKEQEEWDKAEELPSNCLSDYEYFFSDSYGYDNGYFSDWDEFFDYWHDNCEDIEERPEYVWVTTKVDMSMDAQYIVDNATEDLYEDAIEDISTEKIRQLQDFLDGWCKTCGVGATYYESHKYKVKIPWEDYDNECTNSVKC